MTIIILPNIMGIFAFNENGEIFSKKLFVIPDKIAEDLYSIQMNKLIPEFTELLNELKEKGVNELILEDNELAQEIKEKFEFKIQIQKPSLVGKKTGEPDRSTARQTLSKEALTHVAPTNLWLPPISPTHANCAQHFQIT